MTRVVEFDGDVHLRKQGLVCAVTSDRDGEWIRNVRRALETLKDDVGYGTSLCTRHDEHVARRRVVAVTICVDPKLLVVGQ